MEIKVTNVNQALSEALHWLLVAGVEENSRNGPVLVSPEPVMVTYTKPWERVLFSPLRDANPFFHLIGESIWMLAGRNDIAWPAFFNSRFKEYSDDGVVQPAAYGERWRKRWGFDQLQLIVEELKARPDSRRAVLGMWGVEQDLRRMTSRDLPCNTQAYFDLRGGSLNMTVCNRSNDALWGAFGANAVHFSVLQEFLASWLQVPVGVYRQFSNNLHAYLGVAGKEKMQDLAVDAAANDKYLNQELTLMPLVTTTVDDFEKELQYWFRNCQTIYFPQAHHFTDAFFAQVAVPMYQAWQERKEKRGTGMQYANLIGALDWRLACQEWIERREAKKGAV